MENVGILYEMIHTDVHEDGLSYVDLCKLNGVLQTHIFVKSSEPNLFNSVFKIDGDHRDTIREKYLESKNNIKKSEDTE